MDKLNFQWTESVATEFLSPIDAFLASRLIQKMEGPSPIVCEIGVWRGGWINSLCLNQPNCQVIAIDPYPGLQQIKKQFIETVITKFPQVKWHPSTQEYLSSSPVSKIDFIHIDGEHSESAVTLDLEFAKKNISTNGIIVIDDIWHQSFPGIASATLKFVHSSDYVPFLISGAKMYLCHESTFEEKHNMSLEILTDGQIKFDLGFITGSYGEAYVQDNSVKGHRQIIIHQNPREVRRFTNSVITPNSRNHALLKRAYSILKLFIPPVVSITLGVLRERTTFWR